MAINVERKQQGLDMAHKLTVQLLKAHLKGKVIGGQEWKAGNKKKEDLMYDYRWACLTMTNRWDNVSLMGVLRSSQQQNAETACTALVRPSRALCQTPSRLCCTMLQYLGYCFPAQHVLHMICAGQSLAFIT